MQHARFQHGLRLATFLCVAAVLVGGPFYVQVLGGKTRLVRGWKMYAGRATDWCFVHYVEIGAEGERTPLSRLDTLGIHPGSHDWNEQRVLRTRDEALLEGKRLCRALGAGARVGFSMKCGDGAQGWTLVEQDSGDVCMD